ncbi:DUF2441 domain-containing protein [uncultured Megasphaera sp.]|mgnify:CR=1 FL=1|jgi:hypothetical protein|uniref:DUF2441 domain-containing protein n=1 Tax=uncultured Megasphaera sp. TaxID=165188 RepID=UPI002049139B|nr:DUF2441 domain-containing protein [uncultured Megasphaera sp.]DAP96812.1 MAG TPA: Protein of unknown function (DUF2441) [Caudoviricetes sp.]
MEHVENKIFCHINKNANFQIGKTYIFGKKINSFFKFYEEWEPNSTTNEKQLLQEFSTYVRERVFEDVRRENFPKCPSRMKCLWVLPNSQESINYWKLRIPNYLNLVKFKCSGTIHKGDERYLTPMYFNLSLQRSLAMSYWSGIPISNDEKYQEILFVGKATVIEIISLPPVPNLLEPESL